MADSPSEALRRRSKALIVVVGYPESGWGVSTRLEPSGTLLHAAGHSVDAACAELLALLDIEEAAPRRKLKLKR
jgi:hypothetical protein